MDERKELILNTIIKEHVKTGVPVASSILVEKYKLNVSPATVRNDMVFLEDEGLIVQPHTSAGRVPTEKAYRWFMNSLPRKKINRSDADSLEDLIGDKGENSYKETAKMVSQITGSTVFWAPHKNNLFYTGISNLFQQPEFSQLNLIYDISAIIDRIDEILESEYNNFSDGVNVLLGQENPFSEHCTVIVLKYQHDDHDGIFGILGPMRMDYSKNLGIVRYLEDKLSK